MKKLMFALLVSFLASASFAFYENIGNMPCTFVTDGNDEDQMLFSVWVSGFIDAKKEFVLDPAIKKEFNRSVYDMCKALPGITILDAAKATLFTGEF